MNKEAIEKAALEYANSMRFTQPYGKENCVDDFTSGAEWQAKQSPWISVEDELPKTDDDLYFVLDTTMQPPGVDALEFDLGSKRFIDRNWNIAHPTHWMPIPPLPEGGDQ